MEFMQTFLRADPAARSFRGARKKRVHPRLRRAMANPESRGKLRASVWIPDRAANARVRNDSGEFIDAGYSLSPLSIGE
jgi:hypothetical protein